MSDKDKTPAERLPPYRDKLLAENRALREALSEVINNAAWETSGRRPEHFDEEVWDDAKALLSADHCVFDSEEPTPNQRATKRFRKLAQVAKDEILVGGDEEGGA